MEPIKLAKLTQIKRKEDTLVILAGGKRLKWIDIPAKQDESANDSERYYVYLKQVRNYIFIEKFSKLEGNTFIMIDLPTGKINKFDGMPQFSPSGSRMLVMTGKFHNPFTTEAATVYKRSNGNWKEDYRTEAKPFEAYAEGKWTSENRIFLRRYDWEAKTADGEPLKTETILIYEFGEWRKITPKK